MHCNSLAYTLSSGRVDRVLLWMKPNMFLMDVFALQDSLRNSRIEAAWEKPLLPFFGGGEGGRTCTRKVLGCVAGSNLKRPTILEIRRNSIFLRNRASLHQVPVLPHIAPKSAFRASSSEQHHLLLSRVVPQRTSRNPRQCFVSRVKGCIHPALHR